MSVIHLSRGAVEAFLAELALIRVRRQIGVRLPRGGAFDARERNPVTHQITPLSI
jgi:hypothetical protein